MNAIKFLRDNKLVIQKALDKDDNLSVSLMLANRRGLVKNNMDELELNDLFITKSNRVSKLVAIGPVVENEDAYDEDEEVWNQTDRFFQVLVFKDLLGNRLWSYSVADSCSWKPTEGISSELSVHEYQVVRDSINRGYEVDIPLSGSNPTKLSHTISDAVYLAKVGKTIKTVVREQYGISKEA